MECLIFVVTFGRPIIIYGGAILLPRQFKVKKVAELLGTRKDHIYRMVKNNKLRLSGTRPYRISLNELHRYMLDQYPVLVFLLHDLHSKRDNKNTEAF